MSLARGSCASAPTSHRTRSTILGGLRRIWRASPIWPASTAARAPCSVDDRLRLDLDFVVADETRNLKHRVGGTRGAEVAAVCARHRLPLPGVPEIDAGAHDVLETRAQRREARGDLVENERRLRRRIAATDNF